MSAAAAVIEARYVQPCAGECGNRIEPGDNIVVGDGGATHADCASGNKAVTRVAATRKNRWKRNPFKPIQEPTQKPSSVYEPRPTMQPHTVNDVSDREYALLVTLIRERPASPKRVITAIRHLTAPQ